MNENEQSQQMKTEDPSTLIPTMPKLALSRPVLIVGGVILLLAILAALHFAMKPKNTPTETTTETPNGGLVTITPPTGTPAAVPEIVKDKDGKEYLTGELIVAFRSTISVADAKKLVTDAGGTVKQHFTQFPVFLVGISDAGTEGVSRAILKFQTVQGVERAEPNYLTEAPIK